MTYVIATVPTSNEPMASAFLPTTYHVRANGLTHLLYAISEPTSDIEYRDPLTGDLLIRVRTFSTEQDARLWMQATVQG